MNKNILSKIKFLFNKPRVILVLGDKEDMTVKIISWILRDYFKEEKDFLIFKTEEKEIEKYQFFLRNSKESILVINRLRNKFFNRDFVLNHLSSLKYLLLNYDDDFLKDINGPADLRKLTFGFQEGADLRASDVKLNGGTNFKISYKGNIVPMWLKGVFDKEKIYSVLAAVAIGIVFDLNLVEISQSLKDIKINH